MELAAVALWCFLVALAGGVVGLVLGNLRLPLIVLLASSPAAGTGANIAISGVAAAAAAGVHLRAGRVDWRLVAWMGPPSMAAAFAGGLLSGVLPGDALLGIIAAVLLWAGVDLLRRPAAPPARSGGDERLDLGAAVVAGALIGLLGGLVGLILGALRMPALLRLVGQSPARAVGTNLAVGVLVGIAGLAGHLPNEAPDADLLLVGAAASVPGALLGARLTGRLSPRRLLQSIGVAILAAAAAMVAEIVAG